MATVTRPIVEIEVKRSASPLFWMCVQAKPLLGFALIYLTVSLLFPVQGHLSWAFVCGSIVTAALYGWALGILMQSLPLTLPARIGVAWLAIYVIQFLNPVLEGFFFTTMFADAPGMLAGALVFGLVLTAPAAIGAGLLFRPTATNLSGFSEAFRQLPKRPRGWALVARMVLASVVWTAVYLANGVVVSPWVLPYYTTESVGFQLALPSAEHLVALQIMRGLVYTVALLPIIWWSRLKNLQLTLALAGLLYVAGALAIFIISDQFPIFLRVVHGLELAVDSLLGAFAFVFTLRAFQKS